MDSNVLTPDVVPEQWTADDQSSNVCSCAAPIPHVKAAWKGAARTYCARCGLPARITFESR
jgi:hypothetical protein